MMITTAMLNITARAIVAELWASDAAYTITSKYNKKLRRHFYHAKYRDSPGLILKQQAQVGPKK